MVYQIEEVVVTLELDHTTPQESEEDAEAKDEVASDDNI